MKIKNTVLCVAAVVVVGLFSVTHAFAGDGVNECNQAIKRDDMAKALSFAGGVLQYSQNDFEALVCKGRAQIGLQQFDGAIASFQAARNATQDPFQQAVTLALIGGAQKNNGQMDVAFATYQQLLALSQTHKIKRYERIAHNRMGEIELMRHQHEAALTDFQAGDKLAANNNEHADNYAQIASTYRAMAKYEQAIEYQLKAKLIEQQFGDLESQANAMLVLGQLYTEAKQYNPAEETLTKLLKFSQDNGGEYYEALALIHMAKLKFSMHDESNAMAMLDAAKGINKKLLSKELELEIESLLRK